MHLIVFSNLPVNLSYIKPRSYGLPFHEFRPRFALFPVVGTGRIDVAHELVSASVVSRVMGVNSSHVKEGGAARRRQYVRSLERYQEICQITRRGKGATCWNSIDHRSQVRTSSDSRFAKPHAVGTRFNMRISLFGKRETLHITREECTARLKLAGFTYILISWDCGYYACDDFGPSSGPEGSRFEN
ncbi:hypothetical protein AVEN_192084-1 [Araneus ventricosus]|uniref:Uncharacterized protein n=1 Tax=Araneus ventricosus TaxID=182803 RepID=A0A4Y2B6T6_ARAVE|nr:hypothetical protein AVEN_192084-1 [Araneus ventricosus]